MLSFTNDFVDMLAAAIVARMPQPEPKPKPTTRLVDGAELARQLCVSLSFIEKLRGNGTIPSILIRSSRRYDVDEVIAALKERN
ncbi:hypothetical protein K239x_32890 [Planctomycetes bacterium K23_9]|uniref:Helix-turn-helix domain protein n=1 Tax=Stieleria marina TaxID=1930275 RepID=A0A517NVZ5_9BACT|nr:hypothetical protein K239x_32890 [Planctomycetes bacterium K23_9]